MNYKSRPEVLRRCLRCVSFLHFFLSILETAEGLASSVYTWAAAEPSWRFWCLASRQCGWASRQATRNSSVSSSVTTWLRSRLRKTNGDAAEHFEHFLMKDVQSLCIFRALIYMCAVPFWDLCVTPLVRYFHRSFSVQATTPLTRSANCLSKFVSFSIDLSPSSDVPYANFHQGFLWSHMLHGCYNLLRPC